MGGCEDGDLGNTDSRMFDIEGGHYSVESNLAGVGPAGDFGKFGGAGLMLGSPWGYEWEVVETRVERVRELDSWGWLDDNGARPGSLERLGGGQEAGAPNEAAV